MTINLADAKTFEEQLSAALDRCDIVPCVRLLSELLSTPMQANMPIHREFRLLLARHPLTRADIIYQLFLTDNLDLTHPLLLDLCERYYAQGLALVRQNELSKQNRSSAIFCQVPAKSIQHIPEILSSWFPCDADQAFSLFLNNDNNPLRPFGAYSLEFEYVSAWLHREHQKDIFFLWSPRLLRLTLSLAIARQWMRDCIARFPESRLDQSNHGVLSQDPFSFFERLEGDALAWALDHLVYALTGGLGFLPETLSGMMQEARTICTAKCDPMVSRFHFARLWGDAREEMRIARVLLENPHASGYLTEPNWLCVPRVFSEPFGITSSQTFKMLKPVEIYFPWNEVLARLWCCRCVELNQHDFVRWGLGHEMYQAVELARAAALANTDEVKQSMEKLHDLLSKEAHEYYKIYSKIRGKLFRTDANDPERAALEAQLDEKNIKQLLLESLSLTTHKRPRSENIIGTLWAAERIELYKDRYQHCKDDYDSSKTLDNDDLESIDDSANELLMYDCDARCRAYFEALLDILTAVEPYQLSNQEPYL